MADALTIVSFKDNLKRLIETGDLPLPSSVNPEAFRNTAIIAFQDNPGIAACDSGSVFKAIRTLAAAGLVPDGREAALVPFTTKVDGRWIKKCQAMPMVFGLIKMVRRSGRVRDLRAHIVYQNEFDQGRFRYTTGDREELVHDPILIGEKGDPVGAYAIAHMTDGTIVREFMGLDEIDKARRASSNQKLKKGDAWVVSDEPLGIWRDWWSEMAKKTVIRRLSKRIDMSAEDLRMLMVEDDLTEIKDVTPRESTEERLHRLAAARTTPPDTLPPPDPYNEGRAAFERGETRGTCPYDDDPDQADAWLAGWDSLNDSEDREQSENEDEDGDGNGDAD